ncbi:MAG TPA: hypothetical protein VK993_13880 [Chthoniobacterales bacterium]|nr:hypothetical protein [Chthoniobacterales bacterium]
MINDVRELATARPFVPFTIHTLDGGAIHVPTVDHVHVARHVSRVFVFHDDGKYDTIRATMISRVTVDEQANGAHS